MSSLFQVKAVSFLKMPPCPIPQWEAAAFFQGQIQTSGGVIQPLRSPCELDAGPVALGDFLQVSLPTFLKAVEGSGEAWKDGQGDWPRRSLKDRISVLKQLPEGLKKEREKVVGGLMWEIAKSRSEAEAEFDRTIFLLEAFLEEAQKPFPELKEGGWRAQVSRAPLGVALCLGPWNYPFNEVWMLLFPLLLMGNCVILKLPRWGIGFWTVFFPLFQALFPPGVLQVVAAEGSEVIVPALKTGKIDVLAFIGSSAVAERLKRAHPHPHRLRCLLGLDAKNIAVVTPEAPWEISLKECLKGAFSFNGQRCTALKGIWVHRSLAPSWGRAFQEEVSKLRVGWPWEEGVQITPLVPPRAPQALQGLLNEVLSQGGRWAGEGQDSVNRVQGPFFHPAVVEEVPRSSRLALEEQFGPLTPIFYYDRLEEVEAWLLQSRFGMQLSFFSTQYSDLEAWLPFLKTQVARVNWNASCQRGPDSFPFTGRKDSAEGVLGLSEVLQGVSAPFLVAAPNSNF